jgi:penicillin-insensitive murein endopeptidase
MLAGTAAAQDGNPWSRVSRPSAGPAQAIGGFARGCLAGAATLPWDGPGFEAIHLSRGRYYGHPTTVGFVERLGGRAAASGLPAFYVGDMAQARGGPLPFGHASHQTGLDVDIWFTPAPKSPLAAAAREQIDLPSMLLPSWRTVNRKRFGPPQIALLHLAASDPLVDRIFVNPVIKAALCRAVPPAERAWLHRLRPWFGHDDHFHVRLSCPADSPACERQAPVPPGDGCDAILASWVRDQRPPRPQPKTLPPPPARQPGLLPAECHALLAVP